MRRDYLHSTRALFAYPMLVSKSFSVSLTSSTPLTISCVVPAASSCVLTVLSLETQPPMRTTALKAIIRIKIVLAFISSPYSSFLRLLIRNIIGLRWLIRLLRRLVISCVLPRRVLLLGLVRLLDRRLIIRLGTGLDAARLIIRVLLSSWRHRRRTGDYFS